METNMKESFLLYTPLLEPCEEFSNEELGLFFRAIIKNRRENYQGEDLPANIKLAFKFTLNQFRLDDQKYNAFIEKQAANGKLGGRPRNPDVNSKTQKTQAFFEKPKKANKENDNVNDNENENVNEKQDRYIPELPQAATTGQFDSLGSKGKGAAVKPSYKPYTEAEKKRYLDDYNKHKDIDKVPIKLRLEIFIDRFNVLTGKHYRPSNSLLRQFKARVINDGYTNEDIVAAINNALMDDWVTGRDPKSRWYLTPEYILRTNSLERWINK